MAVFKFNTNKEEEKVEQVPVTEKKVTKKKSPTKKKAETKKESSASSRDAIHDTSLKAVKVTKKKSK